MVLSKLNRDDPDIDERYNPAELSEQENSATDQIGTGLQDKEPKDLGDDLNTSSKQAAGQEQAANFDYEPSKNTGSTGVKTDLKQRFVGFFKKRGAAVGLASLFTGGAAITGFFTMLTPAITFVENVYPDLNDWLPSVKLTDNSIYKTKLTQSARGGAIKGCTKLSIRCKLKTFSSTEVTRMNRAGIKINGTKNSFGRLVGESVEFRGKSYTAQEWATELKTNVHAKNAQLRANNMTYRGLLTKGPFGKVMARFGITKKPPGLKGSKQDRLNQLLTAAKADEPSKVKFVEVTDSNGNKTGESVLDDGSFTVGEDGTVKQSDLPEGISKYSQSQVSQAQTTLDNVSSKKTPSATKRASLGAASIIGAADLACSVKNLITSAAVAAKVANQAGLIRDLMPVISLVGKFKAGEASPEDVEALGTFFTEVDTRKIVDAVEIDTDTEKANVTTAKNPNYGRSAMDSALLSMSTNGGHIKPNETTMQYALGVGEGALLSAGGISNIMSSLDETNFGLIEPGMSCDIIQHPGTRIIGTVASVFAAVGTGGASVAAQAAVSGGLIAAMWLLEQGLNSALTGDPIQGIVEDKVGRGEAVWSAMAGLASTTSQGYGMAPASVSDLQAYQQVKDEVNQDYIALEKEDAKNNPFDITNRFSFTGFIARNIGYSNNIPSRITGLVGGSMSMLNPFKPALAKQFDEKRFQQCDDAEYTKLGINADVQCNVRYVSFSEDLSKLEDIDNVIDYMESNGYIPVDSETGLPEGYTPPDMRKSQNALISTVKGLSVGSFVDDRNLNSDYAKYLEACVYRTAPLGATGEENGLIGGIGDWEDGKRCSERTEMTSYFRAYTLLKNTGDTVDNEEGSDKSSDSAISKNGEGVVKAGEIFFDYTYLWGGGHDKIESLQQIIDMAKNGREKGKAILDCSGFVRASLYMAYGIDIGGSSTSGYASIPQLQEVSRSEIGPGDVAWRPGHVEIVTSVTDGVVYTQGARGPGNGGPIGGPADVGPWTKFYRIKADE